jgi:hypothetical protein
MEYPWRSLRSLALLAGAVLAMLAFTGQALAADPSPGDATITVPVGDDIAGGTTNITFASDAACSV